ncbi:MAG: hypothetical protein EBV62_12015, partial [Betaproteobacteria bacterium]|nr:hypothetical protein [Betaproteobacteria bacterium]
DETLQIGTDQPRTLLEGEAVQVGGTVVASAQGPVLFQSAAGVYHEALPGTELVFSPLEKDSLDIKIELKRGTLLTYVASPLAPPRASLVGIGDGVVARTADGLYQITKGADGKSILSVLSGKVILADIAGGVERGSVAANQKLTFPGEGKAKALASGTPESASLKAFPDACREATLMDIAQDGVLGCPEAIEEIFKEVTTARPDLKEKLATQALGIRPELLASIQSISGLTGLQAPTPSGFHSIQFSKRAAGWLNGEPSPLSREGKVLKVVGKLMFLPVPGVIAEVQENSEIVFVETSDRFEKGILQQARTQLKTVKGDVHFAIADGFGDKIQVEVSTPKGVLKAQSTPTGSSSAIRQAAKQ